MKKLSHSEFVNRMESIGTHLEYLDEYDGRFKKIRVRDKLGVIYLMKPDKLLIGRKPSFHTAINKTALFIIKARQIFGDKYDYSKSQYLNDRSKVKIRCPKHGYFHQRPSIHLYGEGCPKCGYEKLKLNRAENGWTKTNWIKFCQADENATPQLYVIFCHDEKEQFIKIGITKNSVNHRMYDCRIPYAFEILGGIQDAPGIIYEKEKELHRHFRDFKYIPCKDFHGKSECFSELIKEPLLKFIL